MKIGKSEDGHVTLTTHLGSHTEVLTLDQAKRLCLGLMQTVSELTPKPNEQIRLSKIPPLLEVSSPNFVLATANGGWPTLVVQVGPLAPIWISFTDPEARLIASTFDEMLRTPMAVRQPANVNY